MTRGFVLQPAGPLDAPVMAAMHRTCFPDEPWDADAIATLAAQPGSFALIALAGDEADDGAGDPCPLGFVLARVVVDDAEIITIGVLPAARGGGVGRGLVTGALDAARVRGATAMFLEVAEDNEAARALYKSCGFLPVGRRPGYYKRSDGRVAAVVLRNPYAIE